MAAYERFLPSSAKAFLPATPIPKKRYNSPTKSQHHSERQRLPGTSPEPTKKHNTNHAGDTPSRRGQGEQLRQIGVGVQAGSLRRLQKSPPSRNKREREHAFSLPPVHSGRNVPTSKSDTCEIHHNGYIYIHIAVPNIASHALCGHPVNMHTEHTSLLLSHTTAKFFWF